jgi:cellulose biosynthesis protein BcsQ
VRSRTTGRILRVGRILCVANQKGGVGKTTTACNVAAGLAHAGLRTLLVDLDPQCNATTGFGVAPAAVHPLISDAPLHESIVETSLAELFVLPRSRSVRDVERMAQEESATPPLELKSTDRPTTDRCAPLRYSRTVGSAS